MLVGVGVFFVRFGINGDLAKGTYRAIRIGVVI